MGAKKKKKPAKMGHNRLEHHHPQQQQFSATFKKVVQLIRDGREAIVDLDGNGTLAIVDARMWVVRNPYTQELEPARLACPVVYDSNQRRAAIQRYQDYQQQEEVE